MKLTPRRKQLLDFIAGYIDIHGMAPTFQEMMDAIAANSAAAISQILLPLEKEGFITRSPRQSRSIKVLFRSNDAPDWRGIAMAINEENADLRKRLLAANLEAPKARVDLT